MEKYDFFKEILLSLQLCLTNAVYSACCQLCHSPASWMAVLWHRAWVSKKAMNPFKIEISWLEAMWSKGYPFLSILLAHLVILSLFLVPSLFISQHPPIALSFSNALFCFFFQAGVPQLSVLSHFCSKLDIAGSVSYASFSDMDQYSIYTHLKHQHHKLQLLLCKSSSRVFLASRIPQVWLATAARGAAAALGLFTLQVPSINLSGC